MTTQNRTETLFLTETLCHGFYLKAGDGFTLGNFQSIQEAKQWCDENGYHLHYTVINQKGCHCESRANLSAANHNEA